MIRALCVAALVGGILLGDRLGPSPARGFVMLGAAVFLAALLVRALSPSGRHGAAPTGAMVAGSVLLLSGVLLVGVVVECRALDGLVRSPLARVVRDRADATVIGTLVEDPSGSRFTTTVVLRVATFLSDGRTRPVEAGRRVFVLAGDDAASRLRVLDAGDRVELHGWFRPLAGLERRYRWRHVVGCFEASDLSWYAGPSSSLLRVANRLRSTVLAGSAVLPPADRALLAGFVVGDTRDITWPVVEQFRASGLSHLLAVSGANVAFVLGLAAPVFARLGLRGRLLTGTAIVLMFGLMTRFEPSVIRACAMATITLLARYIGRPQPARRVLGLAVGALLVVDPFLLRSVGFQLSCGACLGLALLASPVQRVLRGPMWLRESLGASLAAQLGVAPVLLPVFGTVPLVALPANVLAAPLAGPVTAWGIVGGATSGWLLHAAPPLAVAVMAPVGLMLRVISLVARVGATVPVALDARDCVFLVAAIAGVTAPIALARRGRKLGAPWPTRRAPPSRAGATASEGRSST